MDYFTTFKCRTEQLDYLINACGLMSRDWATIFQLEKAKMYYKWASTEIERDKNYVTALNVSIYLFL